MASPKFSDIIPPPKAPSAAPDAPSDESGETYHLTAEELATLNETGTVQCAEGCTITADIGGDSADSAPPEPTSALPEMPQA